MLRGLRTLVTRVIRSENWGYAFIGIMAAIHATAEEVPAPAMKGTLDWHRLFVTSEHLSKSGAGLTNYFDKTGVSAGTHSGQPGFFVFDRNAYSDKEFAKIRFYPISNEQLANLKTAKNGGPANFTITLAKKTLVIEVKDRANFLKELDQQGPLLSSEYRGKQFTFMTSRSLREGENIDALLSNFRLQNETTVTPDVLRKTVELNLVKSVFHDVGMSSSLGRDRLLEYDSAYEFLASSSRFRTLGEWGGARQQGTLTATFSAGELQSFQRAANSENDNRKGTH